MRGAKNTGNFIRLFLHSVQNSWVHIHYSSQTRVLNAFSGERIVAFSRIYLKVACLFNSLSQRIALSWRKTVPEFTVHQNRVTQVCIVGLVQIFLNRHQLAAKHVRGWIGRSIYSAIKSTRGQFIISQHAGRSTPALNSFF